MLNGSSLTVTDCTPPGLGVIWAVPGFKLVLSSLLALITGQALNSSWQQAPPLIWEVMNLMSPPIDGMASDKLSQSPPGELCHSHTLHLPLQPLPSQFLSSICLRKNRHDFAVCTRIYWMFSCSLMRRSRSFCLCMTSLPCFGHWMGFYGLP